MQAGVHLFDPSQASSLAPALRFIETRRGKAARIEMEAGADQDLPEVRARIALIRFLTAPRGNLLEDFGHREALLALVRTCGVARRILTEALPLALAILEERPPQARPPRVGVIASNSHYFVNLARAYAEAFAQHGLETRLIPAECLGRETEESWLHLGWEIMADPPDVLFHINTPRTVLRNALPKNLPNLCHVQDIPQAGIEQADGSLRDPGNSLTYFCVPAWREAFREVVGASRTRFLAPATDFDRYYVPGEPEYACDIAWVASFPNPHRSFQAPWLQLTEEIYRLIRQDRDYASDRKTAVRHLEQAERNLGLSIPAEREDYLVQIQTRIARFALRKAIVDAVLPLNRSLHLCGGGWDILPAYRPYIRPGLLHGAPLARCYREARIHLHGGELNIHWRVFECIASGGFILVQSRLTDFEPGGLNDFLEIGREVITFQDDQDLRDKIEHYLDHPRERREVAERGRARILKEHTYGKRMAQVVADIRARAWEVP